MLVCTFNADPVYKKILKRYLKFQNQQSADASGKYMCAGFLGLNGWDSSEEEKGKHTL